MTSNGTNSRARYCRKTFHVCIVSAVCFTFYVVVFISSEHESKWNENFRIFDKEAVDASVSKRSSTLDQSASSRVQLLVWTNFFSQENWLPSTQELNCCSQSLDVTYNRSWLFNSSAVLLHWRNIDSLHLPNCSTQGQNRRGNNCPPMILFNKEAPPHVPSTLPAYLEDKIMWTVTYRRDSDVYSPYGELIRETSSFKMPDLESKEGEVCWLVSHCQTPSLREDYVESLNHHINVDIYGKCGNNSCPYPSPLDCYKWLAKRYKFYLSFENSICKDYATEKLFYALMTDMIPVVMGGYDYATLLPPHSFIDVQDYSSPHALAQHLQAVSKNQSLYSSYFEWKTSHQVRMTHFAWLCDLCKLLLRTDASTVKPKRNIVKWWFDDAKCRSLRDNDVRWYSS